MYVVGVFYHGSTSVALSSTMTKLTSALNYLVQERNCLRSQLENLNGALSAMKVTRNGRLRTGTMSAAGRARIAAAQRARWAKVKSEKVVTISASERTMSVTSRRKIAAAQKARWAKWRRAQERGYLLYLYAERLSVCSWHRSQTGLLLDRVDAEAIRLPRQDSVARTGRPRQNPS
jgi:hypothetical protein